MECFPRPLTTSHGRWRNLARRLSLAVALCCQFTASRVVEAETAVDYLRDVKPLLAERCYPCHGALQQNGGLRLDTAELARRGGHSGEAVLPGQPEHSLLIDVITGDAGYRMPPEGEGAELTAEQIERLRKWIAQGATAPADEAEQEDPRQFWSYREMERPEVPRVLNGDWVRNPVDAFIAREHEDRGLHPSPEADRATLLRRVHLDLTGIPPTPRELDAFLADTRQDAYERVVDDLLNSPLHGERWGRHWMDVWRYSDWYGSRGINQIRYGQRHAWRWRDWIIESLNQDKGYDQLVREMLAGDELDPGNPDVIRATGFLGRNWYKFDRNVWMFDTVEHTAQAFLGLTLRCCRCHDHKFDPISQEEYFRFRAFFEPHDVRTDPLSIDAPTQMDTGEPVLAEGVSLVYDKELDAPTYLFQRGDSRYPDESRALQPGIPEALGGSLPAITPVQLPIASVMPLLSEHFVAARRAQLEAAVRTAREKQTLGRVAATDATNDVQGDTGADNAANGAQETGREANSLDDLERWERAQQGESAEAELIWFESVVRAERAKLADDESAVQSTALAAGEAERRWNLAQAELAVTVAKRQLKIVEHNEAADSAEHEKGLQQARQQLEMSESKLAAIRQQLESPAERAHYTPLGPSYPRASTGRRSALAAWLTSPTNRRTARVAVNHVWLRHFGEALVPSVANFGMNGQSPTHPELLDWLATELVQQDWSLKHLHRLLVTSATYRMDSSEMMAADNQSVDPENRWYWRMNSRRLESEAIRDSVLHVAGKVDLTAGGPELPESEGATQFRRSLYFRSTPNETMTFLDLFDQANPNECYRRQESVIPQQALALSNSPLALNTSRELAEQLHDQVTKSLGSDPTELELSAPFIVEAFRRILGRQPTPAELEACEQFLPRQRELFEQHPGTPYSEVRETIRPAAQDPAQRARENLIHVLMNHNDFVTIR